MDAALGRLLAVVQHSPSAGAWLNVYNPEARPPDFAASGGHLHHHRFLFLAARGIEERRSSEFGDCIRSQPVEFVPDGGGQRVHS